MCCFTEDLRTINSPDVNNCKLSITDQEFVLSRSAFPVITSPPSIVELRRGATAVLRCTSKGTPDTLVYWVTPSLPSLDANLRLVDVKPSDAGTYECKAKNKWGEDTHVTRIIVRRKFTKKFTLHLRLGCFKSLFSR